MTSSSRSEAPVTFGKTENATDSCGNNFVDSSRPQKQTASELQKLKANCKPEQLLKLRTRCEVRLVYPGLTNSKSRSLMPYF